MLRLKKFVLASTLKLIPVAFGTAVISSLAMVAITERVVGPKEAKKLENLYATWLANPLSPAAYVDWAETVGGASGEILQSIETTVQGAANPLFDAVADTLSFVLDLTPATALTQPERHDKAWLKVYTESVKIGLATWNGAIEMQRIIASTPR